MCIELRKGNNFKVPLSLKIETEALFIQTFMHMIKYKHAYSSVASAEISAGYGPNSQSPFNSLIFHIHSLEQK